MLALDVLEPDNLPVGLDEVPDHEWARHGPRYVRGRTARGESMTYAIAPIKQALAERLGPAAATMVMAAIVDGEQPRVAARRPLVPLIEHARVHGRDYAEVIPAEDVPSRRPKIHGMVREDPTTKRTRALYSCVLEDVVVPSQSNFLLAHGTALLDAQGDELARDLVLAVDPTVVARDGDDVFITQPHPVEDLVRLPEAIWLTGLHSGGFGHWIMEFLPKVWALMERPGLSDVPILIDHGMPPQHEQALRIFAPAWPTITVRPRQFVRVDRLWVVSQLVHFSTGPQPNEGRAREGRALHAAGFRRLLAHADEAVRAFDPGLARTRVYLTRKPWQWRRLVNAPEVDAILERHGFHAVDFADLPFGEQLRYIRGADHVVGQDGSALLMTLFGRQGLRIAGLAQPQIEEWEWYADASAAIGQDLTLIRGSLAARHPDYEWKSDYSIDTGALASYLEQSL
jgi:hypothetical protein